MVREWDQVPRKRYFTENALLSAINPKLRRAATLQLTEIILEGAGCGQETR